MSRNKTPFRGWTRASGAGGFPSMQPANQEISHQAEAGGFPSMQPANQNIPHQAEAGGFPSMQPANQNIPNKYNERMPSMVREETPTGNHTGAIQGTGIRKRTSIVVSFGGHLIRM